MSFVFAFERFWLGSAIGISLQGCLSAWLLDVLPATGPRRDRVVLFHVIRWFRTCRNTSARGFTQVAPIFEQFDCFVRLRGNKVLNCWQAGRETISRTVSARMTCTNGDGYFPILNHGFNSWHRDVFGACDGLIASAGGQPGETQDQNVHKCQWERRMVAKVEPTRLKSSIHENFLPIGPIVKEPASGFLFLLIPFQPGPGSYPAIENREKNNKKTNAQCQWTWNACRKLSRNRFWSRTCHLPCPTLSAPLSPHGCSLTPQGVQLLKLSRHSIRAPLDWAHPENMVATAGVAAAQRKFNCWSCFFLVGSDSAQRSPS